MSRSVLVIVLLAISVMCFSQASGIKPRLSANTGDLEKSYLKIISPVNDIVDGWEFLPYDYRSKTTPFLTEGKIYQADILMNDRYFKNIPVQYDTFQDELVFTDTSRMINSQYPKIILRKEVIDSFSLHSETGIMIFRKMSFDGIEYPMMKNGFYEIAYSGPSRLLIKHTSLIYRRDAINEYDYSPQNYILTKGKWVIVRNQKELYALFPEQTALIKSFIKQHSIKLRKMYKVDLVRLLDYLDSSLTIKTSEG